MKRRRAGVFRPGFDATRSWAVVVYGLALPRLKWAQAVALESAVRGLGPRFCAVPHGDLSERVDDPLPFPVVAGARVAAASVRVTQASPGRPVSFDGRSRRAAAMAYESSRAELLACLGQAGVEASGAPGLYLVAAGPLASARLDAASSAAVLRVDEATGQEGEPLRSVALTWDADPDAARLELHGRFTLAAAYD